jgi:hypothetical protein
LLSPKPDLIEVEILKQVVVKIIFHYRIIKLARVFNLMKSERDKKRKIRKMDKEKRLDPRRKRRKKAKKVVHKDE